MWALKTRLISPRPLPLTPDLFDFRPNTTQRKESLSMCLPLLGSGWLQRLAGCAVFDAVLVDVHEVEDLGLAGCGAG